MIMVSRVHGVKGVGSVSWRGDPDVIVCSATEVCSHGGCIVSFALIMQI